jgi:hypothetical protein
MRLPEAVSRLAAPFFGSQAEPFSRRRWHVGPMVVSVWRLVKHCFCCVRRFCLPMHGVILSIKKTRVSLIEFDDVILDKLANDIKYFGEGNCKDRQLGL